MKTLLSAALALGLISAPVSFAFAQSASGGSQTETPSPGTYAPGSFDAPMHGSHDKGAAVREDNNNGITGRSESEGGMRRSESTGNTSQQ